MLAEWSKQNSYVYMNITKIYRYQLYYKNVLRSILQCNLVLHNFFLFCWKKNSSTMLLAINNRSSTIRNLQNYLKNTKKRRVINETIPECNPFFRNIHKIWSSKTNKNKQYQTLARYNNAGHNNPRQLARRGNLQSLHELAISSENPWLRPPSFSPSRLPLTNDLHG